MRAIAGGQALGQRVGEVILRRIAGEIGERQHDDGKARAGGGLSRRARIGWRRGNTRRPPRPYEQRGDPCAEKRERRALFGRASGRLRLRRGLRLGGLADFERIDPDRLGDVLELGRAEIADREIEPPLDLPVGVLGETDRAGLADALQPRGDIDAVAHQIAVASSTTSPR